MAIPRFYAYRRVFKNKTEPILTFRMIFPVAKIQTAADNQWRSYELLTALFLMFAVGLKRSEVSY